MKKLLEGYQWPGNVRELENMIKTIVVMESEDMVLDELQQKVKKNGLGSLRMLVDECEQDDGNLSLKQITDKVAQKVERQMLSKAISRTKGNKKQAAKLLSISYKSLLNKTKIYGL